MNYLEEYYQNYNEEGRLLSRHGQVEYLTTMRYIRECLNGLADPDILEIGAGTGRYSVTLAKEGYDVTAVELVAHNLEVLRSKLDGSERIRASVHEGRPAAGAVRGGARHKTRRKDLSGLLYERTHGDHVRIRP